MKSAVFGLIFASLCIIHVSNGDLQLSGENEEEGPLCKSCSSTIDLRVPFDFFESTHIRLAISSDGYVAFDPPSASDGLLLEACSEERDTPPIIAPFWVNDTSKYERKISYSEIVDEEVILALATRYILEAYPEFYDFLEIDWVFAISWYHVETEAPLEVFRDFQMALASDGFYSFAIFHYNPSSSWIQETIEADTPVFAGFKNPESNQFLELNGSCSADAENFVTGSNTSRPGIFVLRLDNRVVSSEAQCEDFVPEFDRVVAQPSQVSIDGGQEIRVKGPCFPTEGTVFCTFHDALHGDAISSMKVEAFVQDKDNAFCFTPVFYGTDRIFFEISIPGIQPDNPFGTLDVVHQAKNENNSFRLANDPVLDVISMAWDPKLFPENSSIVLCKRLWNYEIGAWEDIVQVPFEIENTGEASFPTATLAFGINSRLVLKSGDSCTFKHDDIILNSWIPMNKAHSFHRETLNDTTESPNEFNSTIVCGKGAPPLRAGVDVEFCPPTLHLASDDCRFEKYQAPERDESSPSGECFIQRLPFTGKTAAQVCCYESDNAGVICDRAQAGNLSTWTSHPVLFHPKIHDSLHLIHDMTAFDRCCKDEYSEDCRAFRNVRPSDCGARFLACEEAGTCGDPHFGTPDGLEYTFNGKGEYVLTKYPECEVQVRMGKYVELAVNDTDDDVVAKGTVIKGIAVKCFDEDDDVLEVKLSRTGQQLEAWIDGQKVKFEEGQMEFLEIMANGMIVEKIVAENSFNASYKVTLPQSIVTITLELVHGMVNMFYSFACQKFAGEFQGLLGDCDEKAWNDLKPRGAEHALGSKVSKKRIHYEFGETWRVSENESLFTYTDSSYDEINDEKFVPMLYFNKSDIPQDVLELCGGVHQCHFDFFATGSDTFASASKTAQLKKKALMKKTVANRRCRELRVKNGIVIYDGNRRVNSSATIQCDENMEMFTNFDEEDEVVPENYHLASCQENSKWSQVPCCRASCPREGTLKKIACKAYRMIVEETEGWC